jgi:hypothetical protein
MSRPLIHQQELDQEIVSWLEAHPEHEFRESVERAQMAMASPGQWEVTRVVPDSDDGSDESESSILDT